MYPELHITPLLQRPNQLVLVAFQEVAHVAHGNFGDQEVHVHGLHKVALATYPGQASQSCTQAAFLALSGRCLACRARSRETRISSSSSTFRKSSQVHRRTRKDSSNLKTATFVIKQCKPELVVMNRVDPITSIHLKPLPLLGQSLYSRPGTGPSPFLSNRTLK